METGKEIEMLEKEIEKWMKREIERGGGLFWKFTSPGLRGVPDRICVTPRGRVIFVELKAEHGVISPLQMRRAAELQMRGVDSRFVRGMGEAKAFIAEVFGNEI